MPPPETDAADQLFVYGTLMRGFDHPMARFVAESGVCLGPATCPGRLYDLGRYPGLVLPEDAGDAVHGEVYRLDMPADSLPRLDAYEGVTPPDAEYRRDRMTVTLADGTRFAAWVYVYARPLAGQPRIAGGRYLAYLASLRAGL